MENISKTRSGKVQLNCNMNYSFGKIINLSVLLLIFAQASCAQQLPENKPTSLNPEFDKKISSLISFSVPLIGVEQLNAEKDQFILLDTREWQEYQTSHIEGAEYIGYKKLEEKKLKQLPKNSKIVLYCSIGYRSEKIGEQLHDMGFTQVYNLYGSIFEWANRGYPVVDAKGQKTKWVHGYNKSWSKWLDESKVKKTW